MIVLRFRCALSVVDPTPLVLALADWMIADGSARIGFSSLFLSWSGVKAAVVYIQAVMMSFCFVLAYLSLVICMLLIIILSQKSNLREFSSIEIVVFEDASYTKGKEHHFHISDDYCGIGNMLGHRSTLLSSLYSINSCLRGAFTFSGCGCPCVCLMFSHQPGLLHSPNRALLGLDAVQVALYLLRLCAKFC